MGEFYGLMHLAIATDCIEDTLDFYEKLGIREMFRIESEPGEKAWVYYLYVSDGQYLEIFDRKALNPYGSNPNPVPISNEPNRSISHFALMTDDLKRTYETLKAKGIELYIRPNRDHPALDYENYVVHSDCGHNVLWVVDPNGNPIELMQPNRHPTLQEQYQPED